MIELIANKSSNPDCRWGGKAKSLAILSQQGFAVPEGFIISAGEDLAQLETARILDLVAAIGGFPVVVRSSAVNEDGQKQSFAGIYESYLNVDSVSELINKIQKVRESAQLERVKNYQSDSGSASMTVLVQKQVAAVFSGVVFSIHPMTGKEDEILVESTTGLADELVSGKVIPQSYVLNPEGDILSNSAGHSWALPAQSLRELAHTAQTLASFWGRPQDIEWCLDKDNKLWIVQSRPITKVYYRQDIGEWTNADFRDGGVSATACLPFTASIYDRVFQTSLIQYFQDIGLFSKKQPAPDLCGYFYGRLYWNMTAVKQWLKKIPGFDEKEFDEDLGIHRDYGSQGPAQTPMSLKALLPFLPALVSLNKNFKLSLKKAQDYKKVFTPLEDKFLEQILSLEKMSHAEFHEYFSSVKDFHFKVESDYFTTIYNSTNFQSIMKSSLKDWNKRLNLDIHYLDLISDLGNVSHLRVNHSLAQLAEIREARGFGAEYERALQKVVREFYFFSDRSLDLNIARWAEEPGQIEKHLNCLHSQVQTSGLYLHALEKMREAGKNSFGIRWRLKSFFKTVETAREFLIQREEMRDLSTRLYYFVRRVILEMGRRWRNWGYLEKAEDILFIEIETIENILRGKPSKESIQEAVSKGAIRYNSFRDYPSPNEFGMPTLEKVLQANRGTLRGLGCSDGFHEGTAFVAKNLMHAQGIPAGHILVAPYTEPGWTPLFPRLGAVVTEVGGLLSHAAVISREFNLPAVLNVSQATQKIKTGDRLRISGRTGLVEILNE